jgi:hypothetical protein
VTSEALGEDDLLELTSSQGVKPRPTPATSIPGLLSLFQNVRRGCNVAHTYHFERLARSRSSKQPQQQRARAGVTACSAPTCDIGRGEAGKDPSCPVQASCMAVALDSPPISLAYLPCLPCLLFVWCRSGMRPCLKHTSCGKASTLCGRS